MSHFQTFLYTTTISSFFQLGDELCTAYCDLFEPNDHRRFELNLKYAFDCECEVCSMDEKTQEEIDVYRDKYRKLDEQITEEGTLDIKRGLDLVRKALNILTKGLPLVPRLVAKTSFEGFQFALVSGNNLDEANKFIQMAYKARYFEGGEDYEHTKEMLKYMNNPKAHPLYR